ncbi:hypothetical protein [Pseudomonas sp. GCEP-101]|uniref:hypothetical protein n=1 Tax=Pseudomonas sp. GCEP-101 TaxID=2974552 RepID=UPI00223B3E5D|nr:hypothetical protein [Pseudomonas sp. GCEP-101]
MLDMHRILMGCLMGLLAGCAQMPEDMALDSKVSSERNAGLVVGALVNPDGGNFGTWLEFRDVRTGKRYGWAAEGYFSAWLPPGDYEVSSIGSRRGVMGPFSKPLQFTVKQGDINYLGEILYGCPLDARPAAYYGVMNCGFLALGNCTVPLPTRSFCVVDRQESVVRSFLLKNPRYAGMPARSALMSAH